MFRHTAQKFEMLKPATACHFTIQHPQNNVIFRTYQNPEILVHVLNFVQNIVGFHQDQDSYALSFLTLMLNFNSFCKEIYKYKFPYCNIKNLRYINNNKNNVRC